MPESLMSALSEQQSFGLKIICLLILKNSVYPLSSYGYVKMHVTNFSLQFFIHSR